MAQTSKSHWRASEVHLSLTQWISERYLHHFFLFLHQSSGRVAAPRSCKCLFEPLRGDNPTRWRDVLHRKVLSQSPPWLQDSRNVLFPPPLGCFNRKLIKQQSLLSTDTATVDIYRVYWSMNRPNANSCTSVYCWSDLRQYESRKDSRSSSSHTLV